MVLECAPLAGRCRAALSLALAAIFSLAASPVPAAISVAAPPTGKLTRVQGEGSCLTASPTAGCVRTPGLNDPQALAISPDGLFAYGASSTGGAVVAFRRDPDTGLLTRLGGKDGCINTTGGADCKVGKALEAARSIVISPDGKHVYVAAPGRDAVAAFSRSTTTGFLTQLAGKNGCIANRGKDCAGAKQLANPVALAISPDGRNLYVAVRGSNGVVVLGRNTTNGVLTQLSGKNGCITNSGSLGKCTSGHGMRNPSAIAVSGDGRAVLVSSSGGNVNDADGSLARLERNLANGVLTQSSGLAGCLSADGSDGCRTATSLGNASSLAVAGGVAFVSSTPSDTVTSVDVASISLNPIIACANPTGSGGCVAAPSLDKPLGLVGLAFFSGPTALFVRQVVVSNLLRNRLVVLDGSLRQLDDERSATDRSGCVAQSPDAFCEPASPLLGVSAVTVSPDDRHVYALSLGSDSLTAFSRQLAPICDPRATLSDGIATVPFATTAEIQAPCASLENDPLVFRVLDPGAISGPRNGVVSPLTNGTGLFAYTPAVGFIGPDQFVVEASNGTDSAAVTVQVNVVAAAGQPVCRLDVSLIDEIREIDPKGSGSGLPPGLEAGIGVPLAIPVVCQDPEGDPLAPLLVDEPSHGRLDLGTFVGNRLVMTYTAEPGLGGRDTFRVRATDGIHDSNDVIVPINVVAAADVTGPAAGVTSGPKQTSKGLAVTVGCPSEEASLCTGFVTARFPHLTGLDPVAPGDLPTFGPRDDVIGVVAFTAPPGVLAEVEIPLSSSARRRLGSGGTPLVELEIGARDAVGNTALVRTTRVVQLE